MAISYIRAASATGTSVSLDIGAAGNARLVVIVLDDESTPGGTYQGAVTVDGKSASQVALANNPDGAGNHSEMFAIDEAALGASNGAVTVSYSGGDVGWGIRALLYYGVSSSTASDTGIDNTTIAPTVVTVTGIDAAATDLVVMAASNGSTGTTSGWTIPSNTLTERIDGGLNPPASAICGIADCIVGTGITNATLTAVAGTTLRNSGIVAVFGEAATDNDSGLPVESISVTEQSITATVILNEDHDFNISAEAIPLGSQIPLFVIPTTVNLPAAVIPITPLSVAWEGPQIQNPPVARVEILPRAITATVTDPNTCEIKSTPNIPIEANHNPYVISEEEPPASGVNVVMHRYYPSGGFPDPFYSDLTIPDVGNIQNAFIKYTTTSFHNSSGSQGTATATTPQRASTKASLTSTTNVRLERILNDNATNRCHVSFEVWAYDGLPGGPNEFIVRNSGNPVSLTIGPSGDANIAVADIVDSNKCIPITAGVFCNFTPLRDMKATAVATWIEDGILYGHNCGASVGVSPTIEVTANIYVVEFTGSNWSVGHAKNPTMSAYNDLTLRVDSDGVSGAARVIQNWNNTTYFGTNSASKSSGTGNFPVNNMAMFDKGANGTSNIRWSIAYASASPNNNEFGYIHTLENAQMQIYGRNGVGEIFSPTGARVTYIATWPTGAPTTPLNKLSLEWMVKGDNGDETWWKGSINGWINEGSTELYYWTQNVAGTQYIWRRAIIDFSGLEGSFPPESLIFASGLDISANTITAFSSDTQDSNLPAASLAFTTQNPDFWRNVHSIPSTDLQIASVAPTADNTTPRELVLLPTASLVITESLVGSYTGQLLPYSRYYEEILSKDITKLYRLVEPDNGYINAVKTNDDLLYYDDSDGPVYEYVTTENGSVPMKNIQGPMIFDQALMTGTNTGGVKAAYIQAPWGADFLSGNRTIAFLYKCVTGSPAEVMTIGAKDESAPDRLILWIDDADEWHLGNQPGVFTTSYINVLYAWNLIVLTCDGTNVHAYINNNHIASQPLSEYGYIDNRISFGQWYQYSIYNYHAMGVFSNISYHEKVFTLSDVKDLWGAYCLECWGDIPRNRILLDDPTVFNNVLGCGVEGYWLNFQLTEPQIRNGATEHWERGGTGFPTQPSGLVCANDQALSVYDTSYINGDWTCEFYCQASQDVTEGNIWFAAGVGGPYLSLRQDYDEVYFNNTNDTDPEHTRWNIPGGLDTFRQFPMTHICIVREAGVLSLYWDSQLLGTSTKWPTGFSGGPTAYTRLALTRAQFGHMVTYTEAKDQAWISTRYESAIEYPDRVARADHPFLQRDEWWDHWWQFEPKYIEGDKVKPVIGNLEGTLVGSPFVSYDEGLITDGATSYFYVPLDNTPEWTIFLTFRHPGPPAQGTDADVAYWLSWQVPGSDINCMLRGPSGNTTFYLDDGVTSNSFAIPAEQFGRVNDFSERDYWGSALISYDGTTVRVVANDYGSTQNYTNDFTLPGFHNSHPGKYLKIGYQDRSEFSGFKRVQIRNFAYSRKTYNADVRELSRLADMSTRFPVARFVLKTDVSEIPNTPNISIDTSANVWRSALDTASQIPSVNIPMSEYGVEAIVADNPNDAWYVPNINLPLVTAGVPTVDSTDDIWATASHKMHIAGRFYIKFIGSKKAEFVYRDVSSPLDNSEFITHGTDVLDPWEDDAKNAGSFIPQDSMETLNFNGRWFSNEGNGLDFKWYTGTTFPLFLHTSLSGSFWFLPHTDGGAFVSDPKVDGQCIYRIVSDDLTEEFFGVYWNNSKITIQTNNAEWDSSTLTPGQYHHVAFHFHAAGSSGNSSAKIVIDGVHQVDYDLGTSFMNVPSDSVNSCNMYVGAKNLAGDNKYYGYLSFIGFDDPDEAVISQFPRGSINCFPVGWWWNGAVLDYPDQNEWWGKPWGMSSLDENGCIYLPCDDATYPPQDLGGTGDLTITLPVGVGTPTMQVPSYANAPGCMSLAGEEFTIEFDVGNVSDPNASGWSHQANDAGGPNRQMTVSFWFRWKENGPLPSLVKIFNGSWNRIPTDTDNFDITLSTATQTLDGFYGSFAAGADVSCTPDTWHYMTVRLLTTSTANYFAWWIDSTANGGSGTYVQENAKYRVFDFRISNTQSAGFVDLDLAHIQWNSIAGIIGAKRKRDNPDSAYTLGDETDYVVAAPSYRALAGVTTAYRDASFWLNQNFWSCQIGGDGGWINEGITPGIYTRAEALGTLDYLRTNGIVYGLPYTVGLLNSHQGNGIRFYYSQNAFGYAPAMWIKFNAWTTGNQTTIAYAPTLAEDGPDLPWAEWFLEREAGTNRIRSRLTTISGRGFHYPMELITPWVEVGLDEWNFIAFGEYSCENCSPPTDSRIEMSVNGVNYLSNTWPAVFNTNYRPLEWIIGSDTVVTDGFSADINCIFTVYTWDNTTHVLPAYLDGKPDTSLVQAMGGDLFNFISKVNSVTTALDYVVRPGTPSVFGYRPNATGVTPAAEPGPVGSFDLAARMSSTPKWIEVSDGSWGSSAFNIFILEVAFKTSGHSGTGTFKMMCTNKNINGIYAMGLLHDNTTNTVKLFWTDQNDVEYTSTQSVAWPQDQYNHLIINREADFTNDRADLYLNGSLAITVTNIHSGFTPQYGGVFGGAYFGCVSGNCPTDTYISHTGFRMDDGLGITELGLLGDHYAAYLQGDQPSGDQGEDNDVNLGRSDDHNKILFWPRPLTVTEQPADGTILPTATIPIQDLNPTAEVTENHFANLPVQDIFLNTWNPIWVAVDPQDFDVPSASLALTPLAGLWLTTERNYIELPSSNIQITPIGNVWFSSVIETSNLPVRDIPIDLLDPTADVEEKNFITMKSSYLPIDPEDQRIIVTEDNWSDLEVPNLPLVANGPVWSATEDRASNAPTSQLDLSSNAPEAILTTSHWSDLGSRNIPIRTKGVEWTPGRTTDRREVIRFESELAISPEIRMSLSQRFEMAIQNRTFKWTLSLAQSPSMTSNLAKEVKFTTPIVEKDQRVMMKSDIAQAISIEADIITDIKHTLNTSRAIQFEMNVSRIQEFTSASKAVFRIDL